MGKKKKGPKRKLSFIRSGSGYLSQWEREHETLTNLNEMISDLNYLYDELYSVRASIPSACTVEIDIANYDLDLIGTAIEGLSKFTRWKQDRLDASVESGVELYGQTAPEWYQKPQNK